MRYLILLFILVSFGCKAQDTLQITFIQLGPLDTLKKELLNAGYTFVNLPPIISYHKIATDTLGDSTTITDSTENLAFNFRIIKSIRMVFVMANADPAYLLYESQPANIKKLLNIP